MLKGNQIMGLGILLFSTAIFLANTVNLPDTVTGIITGIGIGLEIVGLVKQHKENRRK